MVRAYGAAHGRACDDGPVTTSARRPVLRALAQSLLGAFLLAAGSAHLGPLREEFRAQVPAWLPLDEDLVVVGSGVVELGLGGALLVTAWLPGTGGERTRVAAGLTTGAFLVAVFPGNVNQWVEGVDAFGLTTDRARLVRLFFQPPLVLWALWPTGAGRWLVDRSSSLRPGAGR